jgi:hypothetical protein
MPFADELFTIGGGRKRAKSWGFPGERVDSARTSADYGRSDERQTSQGQQNQQDGTD